LENHGRAGRASSLLGHLENHGRAGLASSLLGHLLNAGFAPPNAGRAGLASSLLGHLLNAGFALPSSLSYFSRTELMNDFCPGALSAARVRGLLFGCLPNGREALASLDPLVSSFPSDPDLTNGFQ